MNTKKFILSALIGAALISSIRAQSSFTSEQLGSPSGFYVGAQAHSSLFWGDMFSLGKETRLGYGAGIYAGYTVGKWFSPELSFDYGVGRLGAKVHQIDDYVSTDGIIKYVQKNPTDMKLGDIYSKTTYMQAGLRLQMGLLNLFSPDRYHLFDIELAPAVYAQKFSPKLLAVSGNNEWSKGTGGGSWSYAAGGDLGFRFRFSPKVSAHLRGGLLWLRNESFEGVNNDPLWRVNLMGTASAGITFHLGKSDAKRVVYQPPVATQPVAQTPIPPATPQQPSPVETPAPVQTTPEVQLPRAQSLPANLQIPALYFRRGYADIDRIKYDSNLDEMMRIVNNYPQTKIRIEGWCDVTGTEAVNEKLSQQRAEALKQFLIEKGVSAGRITDVRGMGVDKTAGYDQTARRAQLKISEK